jgi:DNA repair protein SbcD/Mre11
MLRILHTADIHLGARFSGLGDRSAAQREQLRATFRNVVATAIAEKVSVVLIAGDLFDSNQQPQRNIDLVVEQFNLLGQSDVSVCLIPGTHDPFDASSIYRKVDFERACANLKVFTEDDISCKEYPDLGLTVYGRPNLSNRSYVSPLKGLTPLTTSRFHVAVAHGSLYIPEKTADDDHLFRLEEIRSSGMNYIALGHWHRAYCCSSQPQAWYAGPPEWIPDQRERGVVLLVSLSDSGEVAVEPRNLGLREYDEVEIDTGEVQNRSALEAMIGQGASQNLVRRVTLKGLWEAELIVNTEDLERELAERFFHLRIIDRSHPRTAEISQDEQRLIRTRFIKLMNEMIENSEGDEKDIGEDALQYGVALLDGREVL